MNQTMPPPLKPGPNQPEQPTPEEWRGQLMRHIGKRKRRVMFVRTLAVTLAFAIIAIGLVMALFLGDALTPNSLRISIGQDGQELLSRNHLNSWTSTAWHTFGKIENDEIVWGEERSGEVRVLEHSGDQQLVAFMKSRARVYSTMEDALSADTEGEAVSFGTYVPKVAGVAASKDGVALAWISGGNLYATRGGPQQPIAKKVEVPEGAPVRQALVRGPKGRFLLLTEFANKAEEGAKVSHRLVALTFTISSVEAEESDTAEDPSGGHKADAMPDQDGDGTTTAEAPESGSAGSTEEPNASVQMAWQANDVQTLDVSEEVRFFFYAALKDRTLVFYLPTAGETWKYRVLSASESAGEARDASGVLQEQLAAMYGGGAGISVFGPSVANFQYPHIYGYDNEVRIYLFKQGDQQIKVASASVSESGEIGEFDTDRSIAVENAGIPLPAGIPMALLGLAFAGLIGCVVWLAVNRPIDPDQFMREIVADRVGRDTEKLEKPVATPLDELIPWAGLTRRALAFFVDYLVCIPLIYAVAEFSGRSTEAALNLFPLSTEYIMDGLVERGMALLVIAVYGFVCETMWGRTLGKRILGMRVVTPKGQALGAERVFLRNIMRALELCYPPFVMGAMFAVIFTRKHQRIGDFIAGSAVRIEAPSDDDGPLQEPSDF